MLPVTQEDVQLGICKLKISSLKTKIDLNS